MLSNAVFFQVLVSWIFAFSDCPDYYLENSQYSCCKQDSTWEPVLTHLLDCPHPQILEYLKKQLKRNYSESDN